MVDIKMGNDTTWKIIPGTSAADDKISVSMEYIDDRYAEAKITVTIESLNSRHNKWVDKGDLFISLTQLDYICRAGIDRFAGKGNNMRPHMNSRKPKKNVLGGNCAGLIPNPRFHQVVRGKNTYTFHVGPCSRIEDLFRVQGKYHLCARYARNDYIKKHPEGNPNWAVYTTLGACLLHIRFHSGFTPADNQGEFGVWKYAQTWGQDDPGPVIKNPLSNRARYLRQYDSDRSGYIELTNQTAPDQSYKFLNTMLVSPMTYSVNQVKLIATDIRTQ